MWEIPAHQSYVDRTADDFMAMAAWERLAPGSFTEGLATAERYGCKPAEERDALGRPRQPAASRSGGPLPAGWGCAVGMDGVPRYWPIVPSVNGGTTFGEHQRLRPTETASITLWTHLCGALRGDRVAGAWDERLAEGSPERAAAIAQLQ